MGTRDKGELARLIESGEYKIDPGEVAAAMLKREPWASARLGRVRRPPPSSMLVAAKPLDRPAAGVEQDEPAPGVDLA
jgi:hypothetical protein